VLECGKTWLSTLKRVPDGVRGLIEEITWKGSCRQIVTNHGDHGLGSHGRTRKKELKVGLSGVSGKNRRTIDGKGPTE